MKTTSQNEVFIERVFNASVELVFEAWTNPAKLMQWYAPNPCTISFAKLDVKQGSEYLSCVHIPGGKECWCIGNYLKVEKNKQLVFTMAVANEKGERITAVEAGMDAQWPDETTLTVNFESLGHKTKITLLQTVNEELAKKTGAYPSWLIMFDQLESQLPINMQSDLTK